MAKDKYGRPIKDPARARKKQTWAELMAERQGKAPAVDSTAAPVSAKNMNPNSGKAYTNDYRGYLDTVNASLYGSTHLVNDHSRVYKGGSWNDRAYWLNPATRRYMDQQEASAEIGFRCAMTMVGAGEINPAGKPHFRVKQAKTPGKIK
ncbi:MAG: hypothetical protein INR69_19555 [Mucilaginibacter polytrichastri]|nr:hypothetical protein [Mucilaginibacter polytrichastri]